VASKTDSKGQSFREFPISPTEEVRVTYIERQEWAAGPVLRIQKRNHKGRLVPGPELPADRALDLLAAAAELVNEARKP